MITKRVETADFMHTLNLRIIVAALFALLNKLVISFCCGPNEKKAYGQDFVAV